ncbi:uncharacterized, partial [Tachysurus ichikawai]
HGVVWQDLPFSSLCGMSCPPPLHVAWPLLLFMWRGPSSSLCGVAPPPLHMS